MTKDIKLIDYLRRHILVGDGAMATWLYQNGVPIGVCCEELCLSRPEIVREVHRQYYEAGARLIETNTFGANREVLKRYGLDDQVYSINLKAAQITRSAVGNEAFVVGSMSSITAGRVRDSKMPGYRECFVEQAEALLAGEVDGLILETFLDLEELMLAVETVRSLTSLPIIAQLACQEVGITRDGYSLSQAFKSLQAAGADIVGLNCRQGPAEMLRSLETAVVPTDLPISVFPNAGYLGFHEGELTYASSPEYFAQRALLFREQGVSIIGGCCGTTPEHIRAVAKIVQDLAPLRRVNVVRDEEFDRVPEKIIIKKEETIVDKVKKQHVVLVEWDPPKEFNVDAYVRGAAALKEAGADMITMADNSLAQVRMSNMALGTVIKNKLGIKPLLHLTCRDRNLLGQQSHLMGLHLLGINHILVITGDPSRYGDLPGSSSVFDVSSFDLIRMIKQLNEGVSFSGKPLDQRTEFVVGAAFNPHVNNFDKAIARLENKVAAGADFIMTQPVYDHDMIERIYHYTKHIGVPIFIGIMPLTSARNAEFLHNEVPGIRLTEEALQRMRRYQGPQARAEGLAMARELVDFALQKFNGIYLMTPFNYYDMTAELTRYIKEKTLND